MTTLTTEVKTWKVDIEGQVFEVPAEAATDTETLQSALSSIYPWIKTAKLDATVKDGVMTYKVTKKAGTLGNQHWEVQILTLCDGWVNTWSDDNDKPITFSSQEEAQQELDEWLKDWNSDPDVEPYDPEDFRVVPCKAEIYVQPLPNISRV